MSDASGGSELLPLAGIRVVDLTRLLPGPLATHHLSALGAEVLKIEGLAAQGQDDGARFFWQTDDERARGEPGAMFRALNQGKRLHRLDLQRDEGRAELLHLLQEADVLVEGFRPGVMARLGLGWEALHTKFPRLVMCAISGYGQQGPWAARAGHDINYIAMAGLLGQMSTEQGELVVPNFQIGDLLGGTQAAVAGILAALLGVQRHGRGCFVDISMTHEVARHQVLAVSALAASGRSPAAGRELLNGGAPCYGVYRTADDRHLAVGALELVFWQRFCQALGRPDWERQHWSLGQAVGGDAAMALKAELAAMLRLHTLAHWVALFEPVDCCVTPVLNLDESLVHELFSKNRGP